MVGTRRFCRSAARAHRDPPDPRHSACTAGHDECVGTVLVVGSINADVILRVGHRPEPGETVLADSVEEHCGGKGANQAVAAARAGADVVMVGAVGDDERGRVQVAALTAEGISVDHIRAVRATATGLAAITVTADGENAIVVAPGANALLSDV